MILEDLRSSFRILKRNPGPAAVAVLVLALGIGLTTAMASLVDALLWRPLPFPDGHRLTHLSLGGREGERRVPVDDYLEWRARQTSFEDLAAFSLRNVFLSDGETAERLEGARISSGAFALLDARPLLGRVFVEADEAPGSEPVVVLGHAAWQSRFGGDRGVVGRTFFVDGRKATVVGVMPEGFRFPLGQDVWLPLPVLAADGVDVFGRLRDGVTLEKARLEMDLLGRSLREARGEAGDEARVVVTPYTRRFGPRPGVMFTCLGAVAFVLLIACANVANLLLARTAARGKELALRATLGAGRGRMVAQVLAETACLALPAAAAGLVLARVFVGWLNAAIARQPDWPYWGDVRIDGFAGLVVIGLAGASTLLAGLVPAWRASSVDPHTLLKPAAGGSGPRRLAKGLVVAEVTLATVLLVAAGLMVRSIVNLATVDFGFSAERIFTARVGLPEETYGDDASRLRFWTELLEELRHVPGVVDVALADGLPGPYVTGRTEYRNADKADADAKDLPWAHRAVVTPGFFATLGVEVAEGRDFDAHDDAAGEPVVIVNRAFAEREWPGASALGRRLRLGRDDDGDGGDARFATVVGVVPDLHMDGLRDAVRAGVYVPLAQRPAASLHVAARTSGDPLAITALVRDRVRRVDPTLPAYAVRSLERLHADGKFFYRLIATVFLVLGLSAQVLAAVGLYGVMSFSVSRRTAEMGVRVALGATARQVTRLVVGQGLGQVAAGVVLGLPLAAMVAPLVGGFLYGVEAWDLGTFGLVVAVLAGVGAVASWVPARRATAVDPVRALRHE